MSHLVLAFVALLSLSADAPNGSLVTRPYWLPDCRTEYVHVVEPWVAPADQQSPEDRPVVAVDEDGLIQE